MSKNKIAWEKWKVSEETEQVEIAPNNEYRPEEDGATAQSFLQHFSDSFDMVSTPLGFFHNEDVTRPDITFDCWVGHTNFEITHKMKDAISAIEGVELLSVLSRYRFFIGIGRMFTFNGWNGVRYKIEKSITGIDVNDEKTELNKQTQEIISEIKLQLQEYSHWAIFVFPNGEYDYTSTNEPNDKEFIKQLNNFRTARDITGGTFISSEGGAC